jgi:hypothetical protein
MQFLLNAQELSMPTARDLRQCLEHVRQRQFSEVRLIVGDDGPSLTMLINGASAWLMYLHNQDDVGFHSLNPSYQG